MTNPVMSPRAVPPAGTIEPPDPIAALTSAVQVWRVQNDEIAHKMLSQRDTTLDPIRRGMRPALQPIMELFDRQRAAVTDAAAGSGATLTPAGVAEALAEIDENRRGAVAAIVNPAAEALAAAEAKTREQIATVAETATPEDRADAADLAWELDPLTIANAAPLIANYLRDAAVEKNVGKAAALLPYLRSMAERDHSATLDGLISQATAILATWQMTVLQDRVARIERARWELSELEAAALNGGPDGALLMRLRGYEFPADGADDRPAPVSRAPRPARSYRRMASTPEERAAAMNERRRRAAAETDDE